MDPFVKNILDGVYPTPMTPNSLTDEEKIQKITESFKDIMETLGLDLTNDSLQDTPRRVAKMYVQEIFSGLNPENFPRITSINNELHIKIVYICGPRSSLRQKVPGVMIESFAPKPGEMISLQ